MVDVTTIDSRATRVAVGGNQVVSFNRRAKTYYPDARSAGEAYAVRVVSGKERSGVDFRIPSNLAGLQPFGSVRMIQPAPPAATPAVRGRATIVGS